jgi:hypothetical protein
MSVIAFLALVIIVVLDPVRSGDVPLVALLSGAVLLQLGYEVAIPGLQRREDQRTTDEDDKTSIKKTSKKSDDVSAEGDEDRGSRR